MVFVKQIFIEHEHSLSFQSVFFWCDSQTVLSLIKTEHGSFKPFIAHSITEILDATTVSQWRYISSKFNPADEATKSTKSDLFDINARWFQGPVFLLDNEKMWPVDPKLPKVTHENSVVRKIFMVSYCNRTGLCNH